MSQEAEPTKIESNSSLSYEEFLEYKIKKIKLIVAFHESEIEEAEKHLAHLKSEKTK